ncbi:MAG TPA: glycosyltransferase family 4 protein [Candidatus Acidoferrales bacterium]|jgi:glycosyltransferase involved in cell wall biosynthesis|nr:glycosyltransferase family 4 protein [Candidatus Acidoferrales bacterium]
MSETFARESLSALESALLEAVDADFYVFTYGPIPTDVSAGLHYATVGWRDGRDPNPWFSAAKYLADVPEARGGPPLFHYLSSGQFNGRVAAPSEHGPAYYARPARRSAHRRPPAGSRSASPEAGKREIAVPSELFDDALYSRLVVERGLPPIERGEDPFAHWLRIGAELRIVPTYRFHEDYYRAAYTDIGNSDLWGFMHYVSHGASEGRRPTPWFDPGWYRAQAATLEPDADAYVAFLSSGANAGIAPSPALENYLHRHDGAMTIAAYDDLAEATAPFSYALTGENAGMLTALFLPEWHRGTSGADCLALLGAYLRDGIASDVSPGPLFDRVTYLTRLSDAGFDLPIDGESTLLHWFAVGLPARIVPTQRFDEQYYRATYADIDAGVSWGFLHFIMHGAYEGRNPNARRALLRRVFVTRANGAHVLPPCYRHWLLKDLGEARLPQQTKNEDAMAAAAERRVDELFASDEFREIIDQARALEPSITGAEDISEIWLPPVSEPLSIVHRDVHARFPLQHYDTILCVPWMRLGGADLVASFLAKALIEIWPSEKLLILRTDLPDFEFADRLPREADVVDISDVNKELSQGSAERLLQAIFFGLSPKRVVNVNSGLCWRTIRRFGKRLAPAMDLYACLFCYDRLRSGARTGYATAEFFAETFEALAGVFTDTQSFKEDLQRTFMIPQTLHKKIVPLAIPVRDEIPRVRTTAQHRSTRRPPLVLWAGRFDRQKRFDLLEQIARLMPDVEFRCWGKAVLEDPPDLSKIPPNLTIYEPYETLDELPFDEAVAWLFTSEWEGLPNILLEVASAGLPIVASDVGGVGELVRADTGWPIRAGAPVESYVRALREVIAQPAEAESRTKKLHHIVGSEHGDAQFYRAIEQAIQ